MDGRAYPTFGAVVLSLALLLAPAGCRVDKHSKDGHDDVGIQTPLGGFSVKTDSNTVQQGVGLTVYPGATLVKRERGKDKSADIDLSFGSFHLGVKALSYQSLDPPAKVLGFYRNDLARYGAVIECQHKQPVGQPTRTQDGLTCEDEGNNRHVQVQASDDGEDGHDGGLQRKAGSRRRQHIVEIQPQGSGSKIGLVALDLPEQMERKHHDGSDEDEQ